MQNWEWMTKAWEAEGPKGGERTHSPSQSPSPKEFPPQSVSSSPQGSVSISTPRPRQKATPSFGLAHAGSSEPRTSTRATMLAVRPSLRALQASLLNHLRVPVVGAGGWGNGNARTMSEEAHAHGTYLDRRDVIDRVLSVVKSSQKVDASKVSETVTFKDMGLDSLDEVEVVMALEEEFALEIPDADADKIRSATDAIDYIASHPMAK